MSEHYVHTTSGFIMFKSAAKSWEAVVKFAKRLAKGEAIVSVDGYVVD
jgi:hypothetical protein